MLIHIPAFWVGIILAPIAWLLILSIAGFSFRQGKAIREWYIGLPIIQWPAMLLLVIGCKIIRSKKYCHFMDHEGRYWISPNVEGFVVPKTPEEIV